MLFGDKDAELIGKLAAERKSTELSNARQMGQLIPTEVVASLVERVLMAVKQRLLSSGMTAQEKTELLEQLVGLDDMDWTQQAKKSAKVKL
jgi:phage terminase Nu1 subunit (DNA packaging protein)